MEGIYNFGQGRLVNMTPYTKYVDTKDYNNNNVNAKDGNKDKEGWKNLFNGYRFQIFSPSILRYK
jgi:hypothetical protein